MAEEKKDEKTAGKEQAKKLKKEAPKKKQEMKKVENPYGVIGFVLMTEKAVQNIEFSNKLTFIVNRQSSKDGVRGAVESAFGKKVDSVNTVIDQDNRKKAFVKFHDEGAA